MTHVLPPDSKFWDWFYGKTSEQQVAFAGAHDLEFEPRQLPVDPSNFVPPESELDPAYCDAMRRRAPVGFNEAVNRADAEAFCSGRPTRHYLEPEWFGPEVDLTPYTCPSVQAAG